VQLQPLSASPTKANRMNDLASSELAARKARRIWNQGIIPVAVRRTGKGERLRIRLPDAEANHQWLQNGRRTKPIWIRNGKYWELPKTWFNDFVNRSLERYSKVYIIQPHREQEKCAPACLNARGHECQCSCMGQHHGAGNDGSWFEISDTFATRWGDRKIACRLLTARSRH
jgi:hypothetical protein